MKNESLFPLERNNYFFGKLMTEREFETEQTYGNNKRRMLSLALLNPGVVCGLTVTKADGAAIAVESGLALDGLGRELALPGIVIMRLSELDGFNDDRGQSEYVYLCAEYAESQMSPVHVPGSGSGRYGMVHEGIRLFLRYGEPEPFETESISFEDSRAESLEDKLERRARILLYLARIHIIRWEEAYEIDAIDQVPFGQYAVNWTQNEIPAEEKKHVYSQETGEKETLPAVSFGTAEVKVLEGAKPDSVYYSGDIAHGLGLVPAAVTLGLSNIDGAVFGDSAVFGGETDFTYAACVNNNDGTFKIGVRVKTRVSEQIIRFVWSACADPLRARADSAGTPRITVIPSSARIKPFETLRLSAELRGLPGDSEVIWSVREKDGGGITAAGAYIAPADTGVYTITAKCGDVSGTSIIIVQE